MNNRKKMGKEIANVIIPVVPPIAEMPESYHKFIYGLKQSIKEQRLSVVIHANTSMTCLY